MTHTPMNDEIRKLALSLESDGVIAAYRAYFGPGYPPAQDKIDNLREAIATYLTVAKPAPVSNELEEALDKIDGLESDLDSAVVVAFHRGAAEWVRMNYPRIFEREMSFIKEGGNND